LTRAQPRYAALIIERPILDLLDITKDTPLDIKTDGEALIIRPVRKTPLMGRALAAADHHFRTAPIGVSRASS